MLLESACSCLRATYWSQVLSGEWRCSWSSADRRCSNYIWLINNLIVYKGAAYIRDLTVIVTNTGKIDRYPNATKHDKPWNVCTFLWAQYTKGHHVLIVFYLKSAENFSRTNRCDQVISGCRKSYQMVRTYKLTIPKISSYILTPSKVFISIFPYLIQNAMNLLY